MDTKLKIIIVVFAVVVVFYFFQFVFKIMGKKEHFAANYYDDVEPYEDAPEEEEPKEKFAGKDEDYELRISMLNEIDKLDISDNKAKGNVMENVFSEVTMKKMRELSPDKRKEEIRNIYQAAVNETGSVAQETPVVIQKPLVTDTIKNMFDNAPVMPQLKDYDSNNIRNTAVKALDKLDNAIESLKEMRNILGDSTSTSQKEPYIPDLPIPPPPEKFAEEKPKTPVIEGFENIMSYANF